MDAEELLKCYEKGQKVFFKKNLTGIDLTEKKLSGINLSYSDLTEANLVGVDLQGATLSNVNFSRAKLSGANLSQTQLEGANLKEADLSGVNFNGANLSKANLWKADLTETIFNGETNFGKRGNGSVEYDLDLQKTLEEREKSIQVLKKNYSEIQESNKCLNNQIQEFNAKLKILSNQVSSLEREKNEIKSKNKNLHLEKDKLQEQLAEQRKQNEQLTKNYSEIQESNKCLNNQIQEFNAKLKILSNQVSSLEREKEAKGQIIRDIRLKKEKLENDNQDNIKENKRLNIILTRCKNSISLLIIFSLLGVGSSAYYYYEVQGLDTLNQSLQTKLNQTKSEKNTIEEERNNLLSSQIKKISKSGSVNAIDCNDYYFFSIDRPSNIDIFLLDLDKDADLILWNPSGKKEDESTRSKTDPDYISDHRLTDLGKYKVQVKCYEKNTTKYNLKIYISRDLRDLPPATTLKPPKPSDRSLKDLLQQY